MSAVLKDLKTVQDAISVIEQAMSDLTAQLPTANASKAAVIANQLKVFEKYSSSLQNSLFKTAITSEQNTRKDR